MHMAWNSKLHGGKNYAAFSSKIFIIIAYMNIFATDIAASEKVYNKYI